MAPPAAPTVTGPTTTYTTNYRPVVTWTGSGQAKFQVRVFLPSVYNSAGFTPGHQTGEGPYATWTQSQAYTESNTVTSTTQAWGPAVNLYNGLVLRAYVRIANNLNEWSSWSYRQFTMAYVPPIPSAVKPAPGSTVSTSRPGLGGAANLPHGRGRPRARRQWEFWTTGSIASTINEPLSASTTADIAYPASAARTPQGPWALRCRIIDEFEVAGPWSGGGNINDHPVTIEHLPVPVNRKPSQNVTVEEGAVYALSWDFSDPDSADDYQTAFEIEAWNNSNPGAPVVASGSTATSWNWTAPFGTVSARWKVRLRDRDNKWGPWVENAFWARETGTPIISSPAASISTAAPKVSVAVSYEIGSEAGYRQTKAWLIRIYRNYNSTPELIAGSNFRADLLPSSATAWPWRIDYFEWEVPSVIKTGVQYHVEVYVVDTVNLEVYEAKLFEATYTLPPAGTFVLDGSMYDLEGYVLLEWYSATVSPTFAAWRVYRSVEQGPWYKLKDTVVSADTVYRDYTAPAGRSVRYAVVQVATSVGDEVESVKDFQTFVGESSSYFLVCPEDYSLNVPLYHVTGDSFSDEQETAVVNLLGRGRRIEYGTRYGQQGSLVASMRDREGGLSGREQRLAIEKLRDSKKRVYLRNPFGDVWQVSLASIQLERTPGVGSQEMVTATIEYMEITA